METIKKELKCDVCGKTYKVDPHSKKDELRIWGYKNFCPRCKEKLKMRLLLEINIMKMENNIGGNKDA